MRRPLEVQLLDRTADLIGPAIPNASSYPPSGAGPRNTGFADIIEWEPDQVNIWEVKYSTAIDAVGTGPAELTDGPALLQRYIDQMKVRLRNEGVSYWANVERGFDLYPDAGPNIVYPSQTLYTWSSTLTHGLILYHPSDGSRERKQQRGQNPNPDPCPVYPQAGYDQGASFSFTGCVNPVPGPVPDPFGNPDPAPLPGLPHPEPWPGGIFPMPIPSKV